MKRREFGEPIPMYLVEEDRLLQLLETEHRFHCLMHKGDSEYDAFEYFWDMMEEAGLDQHVTHKEFVEAVKNMSFGGLAELDLALYEEHKDTSKEDIQKAVDKALHEHNQDWSGLQGGL